ncbi:MAG: ATP-dependent DNA helicase [Methylococcaceae bacterium]|nr:MAG: ATP-dependent DNA helicase [Methylococcaceae bacterium]
MSKLDAVFSVGGALAAKLDGYAPRIQQQELAQAVGDAIAQRQVLVAEAGTGTGKTLAYLIPAVMSGQRVVVSTGTKNLQDQLFQKDIPLLRRALNLPFKAALLKGRANYLCLHRLNVSEGYELHGSRSDLADYQIIRSWAGRTRSGDIAEVSGVAEKAMVWMSVTSTADNCLGQECPELEQCFLLKARRQAQEARVVVINHHLLCAEWRLRQTGFGELLSGGDAVIVDEAHQLAETASQFLGLSVTGRRLVELARDTLLEQRSNAGDMGDLQIAAEQLEHWVRELRPAFGQELRRGSWSELESNQPLLNGLAGLLERLEALGAVLHTAAERSKGLESCWNRCEELQENLQILLHDDDNDPGAHAVPDIERHTRHDRSPHPGPLPEGEGEQARRSSYGNWVRWFETYPKSFALHRTPLEIAAQFREFMQAFGGAWVFTSATLSVAQRFEHFTASLGLQEAATQRWESPFDYPNQALLYQPPGLPDTSHPDYTYAVVQAALPVLQASRGRAFMLFTSYQALRDAASLLEGQLPYPLYIQGTQPKGVLLERFQRDGNAILLATASFWEGVDVRGEALSCVIIDKLPFAAPSDPVLKARIDALKRRGVEPFVALQLPQAVIALKQGAGRLIRDVNDRGVLMLCDPRLKTKSYGRVFLNSLPPMPVTQRLETVQAFFAEKST